MNRTSISDLKLKAKDQLLGNYGIATGSFALLFVLVYGIMSLLISAMTIGKGPDIVKAGYASFSSEITSWLISLVISLITSIMTTGYVYILVGIADGRKPVLSDLFFVFKNHPDKVIIISFIMILIQFILLLPSELYMRSGMRSGEYAPSGKQFLMWILLYLAGIIAAFIVNLLFAMCYMIYIDDPETDVSSIIRGSISMMRGNKFRYFYMILSFIGYYALILLSLGIAALWVVPYQTMTTVEFYRDLKGDNYGDVI